MNLLEHLRQYHMAVYCEMKHLAKRRAEVEERLRAVRTLLRLLAVLTGLIAGSASAQVPDSTTAAADYVVGSDITDGLVWSYATSTIPDVPDCQWQETEWYVQRDSLVGTEPYLVLDCPPCESVDCDTCASLTTEWQPVYATIKSYLLQDTCTGELRLPKRKEN